MPQDKTYLNIIVDLYFSVPVSEISLFCTVGQFECKLENWKRVSEQAITCQLNKPLLLPVNFDLCCVFGEMKVWFAQSAEWWIWSGHISGDKQQGCEVNQAFQWQMVPLLSVCLRKPILWFMYIAAPKRDWLLHCAYFQVRVGNGTQASFPCI